MRFTMFHGALMLSLAVVTGGCAMQKGKAEAAVATADSSLQAMAAEAQAYVPTCRRSTARRVPRWPLRRRTSTARPTRTL